MYVYLYVVGFSFLRATILSDVTSKQADVQGGINMRVMIYC